jgi:shikimate dehydrogenase|tara:strand:+ start:40 stop:708 length:669 start_codon:yes stop_codon:yes gene_type:complete
MKIDQDTLLYGSFAEKAGSKGCKLFNTCFDYYQLNAIYKSFSVNNIKQAVEAARTLDIKGFAVTMPYKIDILPYLDEHSEEVETIGAANTVINNEGILKSYNTDYLAAESLLRPLPSSGNLTKCVLYILGDGGYSKAVQHAAQNLNLSYSIINRTNWTDIKDIQHSTIYNCTPVEHVQYHDSNNFIDCIGSTLTGQRLGRLQASYQFKLYTGLEMPIINKLN